MLNALGLFEKDGQILVSSVDVAENFEKRHKNVVRAIENLKVGEEYHRLNFEPMIYTAEVGKGAKLDCKGYYMTRDGFTLLVMGFTGYKAQEWKIKYIKAFNAMEAKLKEGAVREAALPEAKPADEGEAARLRLREKQAELREREIETRLAELELRRRDYDIQTARLLASIAELSFVPEEAKRSLVAGASSILTGKELPEVGPEGAGLDAGGPEQKILRTTDKAGAALPVSGRLYSASELGKAFGTNSSYIGKIAKQLNLSCPKGTRGEFGEWIWRMDGIKRKHRTMAFVYNERGRAMIAAFFRERGY